MTHKAFFTLKVNSIIGIYDVNLQGRLIQDYYQEKKTYLLKA